MIDLTESSAERHLRLRIEVQATEDQNPVVFQRVEDGFADRIVGGERGRVEAGDLGADATR